MAVTWYGHIVRIIAKLLTCAVSLAVKEFVMKKKIMPNLLFTKRLLDPGNSVVESYTRIV